MLTRERLAAAVDEVPASFLEPLVDRTHGPHAVERRRAAFVAVLWKRLRGGRASFAAR